MKTPQNVLKMSTVSPDTSRETDGDTTDWWLQQQSNGSAFSIQLGLTVSVSVLRDVIEIKRFR